MVETLDLVVDQVETTNSLAPAWWAVVSRFLLHGLIVSTWISRIPALQSALGLTNAGLGMCLLGTAVGSIVAIPSTGWLISRFGSKRITAWSTVGFAGALIAPAWAFNGVTLFAALIVFGAMAGANDVSINAQGVAVEKAAGTPSMSRFHAMFSIGGMTGAALGGLMAAHAVSPRVHLCAAAVLLAPAGLVTAPMLFDAPDRATKRSRALRLGRVPPVLLTLAAVGFCMFLSEGAIADWSGIYLKQVLNADHGLAAAGYAVFSCGMAVFRLVGDAVTKRLGAVLTVRTGALMAAAGLVLALAAPSAHTALPGFALTGAGLSVIVPLVFAASGRTRGVGSGAGIAIVSGSGYLGFLFGPALIGLVAQASSLRAALCVVVALTLVAALLAGAVSDEHTA